MRSIASIAALYGSSRGATRSGAFRTGGIADSNAWRTVRRCTPMLVGQRPNRQPLDPVIAANRRKLLHSRPHPSASTFVISDPGHPDADHGEVGPVQAVTTVAACRKGGAKSDRHNNTPPPRRWGHLKPSPWGQLRLSRPQGGPLSPLLCNVYLHRLDRMWDTSEHGVLVRYCDDLVVMCRSRDQAQAALERLTVLLGDLGLEPKASKTRIVHLVEGGQGVDFLGFHNRLVRGRTPRSAHLVFLGRWPARKAITRIPSNGLGDHCPFPPVGAGRVDRGGTQLVPARMGGVFPLRQLRTDTRPDQELCLDPARAVAVQTGQTPPSFGVGG